MRTQGHPMKLMNSRFMKDQIKYFFVQWVIQMWKWLPEDEVMATDIVDFKRGQIFVCLIYIDLYSTLPSKTGLIVGTSIHNFWFAAPSCKCYLSSDCLGFCIDILFFSPLGIALLCVFWTAAQVLWLVLRSFPSWVLWRKNKECLFLR